MAIRKIARMGHPVLREKARPLKPSEIRSDEIRRLIADMVDTMHEYGGIGLAAPQIHESVQLALIEYEDENERYPGKGNQPLTVLVNPRITVLDETEQSFWEGCLSVPELRGLVSRPRKVQIDYLDEEGRTRKIVAEDFLATVFQHELDHLDGKLFVDRMTDMTKLAFLGEYRKYWAPEESGGDAEEAESAEE